MLRHIQTFLDLVKFEHTIFALPFAYLGALLAAQAIPEPAIWLWITLAMVVARTAGMCLNRLIDREIDAENPRTKHRPLQQGLISRTAVWGMTCLATLLLIYAAAQLPPICLALSPVAIFLLTIYSYLKRFTWLCHFGVGLVLACAPVGGWLAVSGAFSWEMVLLAGSVCVWVAGFDIIYATLDLDFDRQTKGFSIPKTFGLPAALHLSSLLHVLSLGCLVWLGIQMALPFLYWVGVAVAATILWYEHRIISPTDLSRVNQAFFVLNGWVSAGLFAATFLGFLPLF